MRPARGSPRLIVLAYVLNGAGLAAVVFVLVLYRLQRPVDAAGLAGASNRAILGEAASTVIVAGGTAETPRAQPASALPESPTPFIAPGGLRPRIIGRSVEGRPLEVYTFGDGPRLVMVVAGIHGGHEWNTIALADELIAEIAMDDTFIPTGTTLFILRNLNPDGDARSHSTAGRTNDGGVDLNRNFPVNWEPEWDREGCWDYAPTTAGSEPGSEPETRAAMGFLVTNQVQALISYHSAALGVFPGGEPWDADSIRFAEALGDATGYPFPPIDTGCHYTGTLADYAVSRGATAVDMELANHLHTDFEVNLKALQVLLQWEPER